MDRNTGHLVSDMSQLAMTEQDRYTPVPFHLRKHAERELGGKKETYVNLNENNELTAWAKNRKEKGRTRAKLAKKSRKASRK